LIRLCFYPNIYFDKCKSQNDNKENIFLNELKNNIKNKYFIEIGFHHIEYNCICLVQDNFQGLMIDGGRKINIFMLKLIFFLIGKKIHIKNQFITRENIISFLRDRSDIGCLSIDIDGNDFWIIKKIIDEKIFPEIIVIEYNASFLEKSISIPYEENFDRKRKHFSGFYHGASLKAYYKLLSKKNYHLVRTIGGSNAFFVNTDLKNKCKLKSFQPEEIYEECKLRNLWSNSDAKQQFDMIKHLKFDEI